MNRLRELEKIAEKLGIGQNREVECFCCKKTVEFKKAITLTNKKKVTYLCKDCYKKLESGDLNKSQIGKDEILKELEKAIKIPGIQPAPYNLQPVTWTPETDEWNPSYKIRDEIGTSIEPILDRYLVSSMEYAEMKTTPNSLLKFESKNKHDYKTNSTTNK